MYPRLVYRTPGPHLLPGGTYDHKAVADEGELSDALEAGWFATVPEAVAGKRVAAPVADDAPPTRAELEQKATELGIKVDGRWSEGRLGSEIAKALKGK